MTETTKTIDILLLGSGGREHALAKKLAESPRCGTLYIAPGNGGTLQEGVNVALAEDDPEAVAAFAREEGIGLVVIGPEAPLVAGVADAVRAAGVACFGPDAEGAQMGGSKRFSKELMERAGIPTAAYGSFTDEEAALAYVREQGAPLVVKADGLAAGKGVVVATEQGQAEEAVRECFAGAFGDAGSTVVIEECMVGPEVTVLAFCDGEHLVPMLSSQDHKRAYDGNQGPNTGGMGAFCPSPKFTPQLAQQCMDTIFLPTVNALNAEGRPFKGVIYFGLMLTKDGPKVVEYNARFGDPETQPLLSMLDSDLMDIFEACVKGTLDQVEVKWKQGAACCIVLASGGYPVKYQSGYPISGLEEAGKTATVFHAGTKLGEDGSILTAGGRVLGVTALGATLEEAIANAYAAAKPISFQDMHMRTDIGKV